MSRRKPDEGGIVGHAAEVDPAEPAQHETIGHALLRFLEAPVVKMFNEQETQDGLYWRGMPSPVSCVRKAPCEVSLLQCHLVCEMTSGARSPIRRYELPFGLPSRLTSLLVL